MKSVQSMLNNVGLIGGCFYRIFGCTDPTDISHSERV